MDEREKVQQLKNFLLQLKVSRINLNKQDVVVVAQNAWDTIMTILTQETDNS